jgi:hypothetical protein
MADRPTSESVPPSNLPGFDYAKNAYMAWLRWLTATGSTANQAWGELKAGKFGWENWTRTAATMWERSYQAFDEVVRGSLRSEAPALEVFHYSRSAGNAPTREVTIDRSAAGSVSFGTTGADFTATPLRAMGTGQDAKVRLVPQSVGEGTVRITFAELQAAVVGEYIGFIYRTDSGGRLPVLAVMLLVTDDKAKDRQA